MLQYLKSGSWILPAGIILLVGVFGAWGAAFALGKSNAMQSTWTGYGAGAGLLGAVAYTLLSVPKNLKSKV